MINDSFITDTSYYTAMQVPTMAIEKVFIYNNTSIIQDEVSWAYLHNFAVLHVDLQFGPIYVQRGQVVKVPDSKYGGHGFKSCFDH